MKPKATKKADVTAEQKVLEAAKRLFTKNGYDATKTRDIAKEAGINLALLNYYYGSKEKLFEIVIRENMQRFAEGVVTLMNDKNTTWQTKVRQLVNKYIDNLSENPDLPFFVLSQVRKDPKIFAAREKITNSYFMKQLHEAIKQGEIAPIEPISVIMNIVSLSIFPFIARQSFFKGEEPIIKKVDALVQERRVMVPEWIFAMLQVQPPVKAAHSATPAPKQHIQKRPSPKKQLNN